MDDGIVDEEGRGGRVLQAGEFMYNITGDGSSSHFIFQAQSSAMDDINKAESKIKIIYTP